MTGNCAAGKERTRTDGRESGGPVLEEDLWGSSRACEMRDGREAGIWEKDERSRKGRKMMDRKGVVGTHGCPEKADGRQQKLTWKGVCWACQLTVTGESVACLLQGRFHILVP
jgi:hypothetical protein